MYQNSHMKYENSFLIIFDLRMLLHSKKQEYGYSSLRNTDPINNTEHFYNGNDDISHTPYRQYVS